MSKSDGAAESGSSRRIATQGGIGEKESAGLPLRFLRLARAQASIMAQSDAADVWDGSAHCGRHLALAPPLPAFRSSPSLIPPVPVGRRVPVRLRRRSLETKSEYARQAGTVTVDRVANLPWPAAPLQSARLLPPTHRRLSSATLPIFEDAPAALDSSPLPSLLTPVHLPWPDVPMRETPSEVVVRPAVSPASPTPESITAAPIASRTGPASHLGSQALSWLGFDSHVPNNPHLPGTSPVIWAAIGVSRRDFENRPSTPRNTVPSPIAAGDCTEQGTACCKAISVSSSLAAASSAGILDDLWGFFFGDGTARHPNGGILIGNS